MKVFELAKELNIGAIDLVEKLKAEGMNVRNHMVALTDEEVLKARSFYSTAAEPEVKKTITKKRIVKKAATEETVAPAKVAEAPAAPVVAVEAPTPEEKVKETTVIKKSATKVIRKDAQTIAHNAAMKEAQKLEEAAAKEEALKEESTRQNESGTYNSSTSNVKKDYLEEKMHSFTPIFVPEAKKDQDKEKKLSPHTKFVAPDEAIEEDDETKEKNKKRMGDLAAAVNKKAVAKVKDINQLKADEELKYAFGLLGKAIYTPAKKKKAYSGPTKQTIITEVKDSKRVITIHDVITAEELAQKLSQKFDAIKNQVLDLNLLIKPEDFIGLTLANEIAALYNYRVENKAFSEAKVIAGNAEVKIDKSNLPHRNPIITIMGHVDHGKTTLVDYIRKAKVADGEAGGITQHIGAYSVNVGKSVLTFLDTPGHAAFANMRQRGANVTDIVVLVVAADDGVMPQTVESIKFCQNAKVPVIVAVNKIDKPSANPDKVKQQLMEFGLTPEDWGGETQYVNVSGLKGTGVDGLLESIKVLADVLDLRADNKGPAEGVVIESKIEIGRGPVATVLVQKGTLNKGDSIVVGETFGRARSMTDFLGKNLDSAGPSTPVQILGLDQVPSPGDTLNVLKNEREAKKIVDNRIDERKKLEATVAPKVTSLEDFFKDATVTVGDVKTLNLIVRSDVQGSFEAIKNAVQSLGNNEVKVDVIGGGVGAITDNDVLLASSSGGYIMGFNMRPVTTARKIAEQKGVEIKTYSIIYELINEVKLALEGMLAPLRSEKYIGRAEVKETFSIPKVGTIAGTSVIDGKIERGCSVRLLRDGKIVYDGKLSTLKRFKDEVKEVKSGLECGMALENFDDVKVSDIIEAYIMEEKKRTLESNMTL
jgi:translation initiation factor IF-2